MKRVRLIHWKAEEAEERCAQLRAAGYEPEFEEFSPALLRALGADPPVAVVIDLSRLPSQGRDVAVNLRLKKATRGPALAFVGGDPEKVKKIRELLPDAGFGTWDRIGALLEETLLHQPLDPVVPESVFAAFKDTPLAKKLGIQRNSRVLPVNAPENIPEIFGELPEGVTVTRAAAEPYDVCLWFVREREELERDFHQHGEPAEGSVLWIVWPKQRGRAPGSLTQNIVRARGLAAGLVDFKVCSVDETWSGLLFTRRKA